VIALVLISHSAKLAEGAAEVAAQRAPDLPIEIGGGLADGSIGTSPDVVTAAVERALSRAKGAVLLADLGSAVLTADLVIELNDGWGGKVKLASAPFVEGAVAAAVFAQQDVSVDAVVEAAQQSGRMFADLYPSKRSGSDRHNADRRGAPVAGEANPASSTNDNAGTGPGLRDALSIAQGELATATVTVRNPMGLHARPAAVLARAVAERGVSITIDGVDASSVLMILTLGATGGRQLTVTGTGVGAQDAVNAVVQMIDDGFGEVQ
jgi:PTS hybrid protein